MTKLNNNKENDILKLLLPSAIAMVNLHIKKNKLLPMYEQVKDDSYENLFSISYQIGIEYTDEKDIVEEIYQSLLAEYPEYGESDEL